MKDKQDIAEVALRSLLDRGIDRLPYNPLRSSLYTPDELMHGYKRGEPESFFSSSRDAAIYSHYDALRKGVRAATVEETLAESLHDHNIAEALEDYLKLPAHARPVAIMGGHAMRRDDPSFLEVAQLGHALANEDYLVVTGGGPGAMEAANLGAALAGPDWTHVVDQLSVAPSYRDAAWFDSAYAVLEEAGEVRASLAIPTWFYGHEPSNLFATQIAKFFSNALREEGLLAIATHGIVFAPGSAGTVQEIFQDAAQNHYKTYGVTSPMVLLGRRYWTETLPAYPLLETLAGERDYARQIALVDKVEDAVAFILSHGPALDS